MRRKGSLIIDGPFVADRSAYFANYTTFSGQAEFQDRIYTDNILNDNGVLDIGTPGTPDKVTASGEVYFGGRTEHDGAAFFDAGSANVDSATFAGRITLSATAARLAFGSAGSLGHIIGGLSTQDGHFAFTNGGETAWVSIFGASNRITAGSSGTTALNLGATATTDHSLGQSDVLVGGMLEVEGNVYTDSNLYVTGSQIVNGDVTSSGVFNAADGAVGAPSYGFTSDPGNGMYLAAADTLGWSTNSAARMTLSSSSLNVQSDGILLTGGQMIWNQTRGFQAASNSSLAWLVQDQTDVQNARVIGSADAAGETAVMVGTRFNKDEGAELTTLLHIGNNTDSTSVASAPVPKFEFYGDGRAEFGLNSAITTTSGTSTLLKVGGRIEQQGTAGYTYLHIDANDSSGGSGTKRYLDITSSGTSVFSIDKNSSTTATLRMRNNGTILVDEDTGIGISSDNNTDLVLQMGTNNIWTLRSLVGLFRGSGVGDRPWLADTATTRTVPVYRFTRGTAITDTDTGIGSGGADEFSFVASGVEAGRVLNTGIQFIGGLKIKGYTSTAADPSTTEYPSDKDLGIHKNTSSGSVFLTYNDGGVIKKVELT